MISLSSSPETQRPYAGSSQELLERLGYKGSDELDALRNRLGVQHEQDTLPALLKTKEGEEVLLKSLREQGSNGQTESRLAKTKENIRQLEKKESFLKKFGSHVWRNKWLYSIGAIGSLFALQSLGFNIPASIEEGLQEVPVDKIKKGAESFLEPFSGDENILDGVGSAGSPDLIS